MRPTTPIPNGCSFSLLTMSINFGQPPPTYIQPPPRTDRPNPEGKKKYLHRQKVSLRNKKSDQYSLKSFEQQLSKMGNSGIERQIQNFFQLSSIMNNKNSKKDAYSTKKAQYTYNNKSRSQHSTQRGTQRTSLTPIYQQKQNFNNNQYYNATQTNVFTDEITLNQQSGRHQNRHNSVFQINNQRRIHTQYDHQTITPKQKYVNQKGNRQKSQVTRSQFINYQSNLLLHSPTISTLKKQPQILNQFQKQKKMQRNQIIKKNSFMQINSQPFNQKIQKAQNNSLSNQLQIYHEPSNMPLLFSNQSHQTHVRKLSSPRFEKKFKTLVDLTYKNVSSDGSKDRTSSNHISIVASQDSINQTNFGNNESLSKRIKMMTLKSLPLKQQVWSQGSNK